MTAGMSWCEKLLALPVLYRCDLSADSVDEEAPEFVLGDPARRRSPKAALRAMRWLPPRAKDAEDTEPDEGKRSNLRGGGGSACASLSNCA